MDRFYVRVVLTRNRHRLPMVIDRVTCMPDRHATINAISLSRPASGSHSKIEQTLRGVAGLLSYLDARAIEFEARVEDACFLSVPEMDGLVQHFSCPNRSAQAGKAARAPNGRTVALRVRAARDHLDFLISLHAHELWRTPEAKSAGLTAKATFLEDLTARARVPMQRETGERRALTAEQEAALTSALDAMTQKAKASGNAAAIFAADRTKLWFEWEDELGLRTGEMLGLRLHDLDLQAGTCRIVRRRDAADDPRRDLARVKSEGRLLGLSPYLTRRTREHVETLRAAIPAVNKHDFLLVSARGAPLSRSNVNKVFARLRKADQLLIGLCNCSLRHTWNEHFSEDAAAAGLGAVEEAQVRAYAQGWKSEASAQAYLAHRRRRRAAEISRLSQERQMATRLTSLG